MACKLCSLWSIWITYVYIGFPILILGGSFYRQYRCPFIMLILRNRREFHCIAGITIVSLESGIFTLSHPFLTGISILKCHDSFMHRKVLNLKSNTLPLNCHLTRSKESNRITAKRWLIKKYKGLFKKFPDFIYDF